MSPDEGQGQTWYLIERLFGRRTGGGTTGGTTIAQQIFPLYDVLPQWLHTTARNISLLILLTLFIIFLINFIRISFKNA